MLYLVVNFVLTSLVQPHFVGDAVGLSITVTFLALVFWGWLLGPVGAVLAVPLTLLVKAVLVDSDPRAGWAAALAGLAAAPDPEPDPSVPSLRRRTWRVGCRPGTPHPTRAARPEGNDVPVTHACGHDVHVSCLVGATAELAAARDTWSGTLLAVFQPAEEIAAGARAMIDDGLFDRFGRPDVVLGQHVAPLPAGMLALRPGPAFAGNDTVRITLHGSGGHGSRPETTVDPVVMAAATVLRLQTIVSREIAGTETAVLTVGTLRAGTQGEHHPRPRRARPHRPHLRRGRAGEDPRGHRADRAGRGGGVRRDHTARRAGGRELPAAPSTTSRARARPGQRWPRWRPSSTPAW